MPGAGEYHGDPVIVGCFDDFAIAHRAARLDHGGRTSLDRNQEPIREWGRTRRKATTEPCVRGAGRPASVRGNRRPCAPAIRAASTRLILTGPDPDRGAILGIHDGIRFHMLGDPECEPQIGQFRRPSAPAW